MQTTYLHIAFPAWTDRTTANRSDRRTSDSCSCRSWSDEVCRLWIAPSAPEIVATRPVNIICNAARARSSVVTSSSEGRLSCVEPLKFRRRWGWGLELRLHNFWRQNRTVYRGTSANRGRACRPVTSELLESSTACPSRLGYADPGTTMRRRGRLHAPQSIPSPVPFTRACVWLRLPLKSADGHAQGGIPKSKNV